MEDGVTIPMDPALSIHFLFESQGPIAHHGTSTEDLLMGTRGGAVSSMSLVRRRQHNFYL